MVALTAPPPSPPPVGLLGCLRHHMESSILAVLFHPKLVSACSKRSCSCWTLLINAPLLVVLGHVGHVQWQQQAVGLVPQIPKWLLRLLVVYTNKRETPKTWTNILLWPRYQHNPRIALGSAAPKICSIGSKHNLLTTNAPNEGSCGSLPLGKVLPLRLLHTIASMLLKAFPASFQSASVVPMIYQAYNFPIRDWFVSFHVRFLILNLLFL